MTARAEAKPVGDKRGVFMGVCKFFARAFSAQHGKLELIQDIAATKFSKFSGINMTKEKEGRWAGWPYGVPGWSGRDKEGKEYHCKLHTPNNKLRAEASVFLQIEEDHHDDDILLEIAFNSVNRPVITCRSQDPEMRRFAQELAPVIRSELWYFGKVKVLAEKPMGTAVSSSRCGHW